MLKQSRERTRCEHLVRVNEEHVVGVARDHSFIASAEQLALVGDELDPM
jgi:hypothetical protein